MAFTNFDTKEINCKVIYFGPRGAGKTENLKAVYKGTANELKTGLLEFEGSEGSTKFFDFLPISLGHVRDFHLKLHLFTVPVNSLYQTVSSVILKGVDGFIFVADSRVEAMANNVQALKEAQKLLLAEGYNMTEMPRVIQYNKRDLTDILPIEIMRQELNLSQMPDHKAIATQGIGTTETLQSMAQLVLKKITTL